jgi:hypothetical protein
MRDRRRPLDSKDPLLPVVVAIDARSTLVATSFARKASFLYGFSRAPPLTSRVNLADSGHGASVRVAFLAVDQDSIEVADLLFEQKALRPDTVQYRPRVGGQLATPMKNTMLINRRRSLQRAVSR